MKGVEPGANLTAKGSAAAGDAPILWVHTKRQCFGERGALVLTPGLSGSLIEAPLSLAGGFSTEPGIVAVLPLP